MTTNQGSGDNTAAATSGTCRISFKKVWIIKWFFKNCLYLFPRKITTGKEILLARIEARKDLVNILCKDVFKIWNTPMLEDKEKKNW